MAAIEITSVDSLRARIQELELQKTAQEAELKKEIQASVEALRPANLIKHTVNDLISSPEFRSNIFNGLLGMASDFVLKKIIPGSSNHPIKKLLNNLLHGAIDKGLVAGQLQTLISKLVRKFTSQTEKPIP